MLIKKEGKKAILKRMIDLDLKHKTINEAMGYQTKRGFKDLLGNIHKGTGHLSEEKLQKLETILDMSLEEYYDRLNKFVVKIYEKNEKENILINSITTDSLKEIKRVKKFAMENYPDKKIIVKEKTRKGWVEIDI